MCLASSKGRAPTKAPVGIPVLEQMKRNMLPPKSKTVHVKSHPGEKTNGIVKVPIQAKSQEGKIKPKLAPRANRQTALNILFRDSFTSSPSTGKLVLVPRVNNNNKEKSVKPTPCFVSVKEDNSHFETMMPTASIGIPVTPRRPTQRLPMSLNPPPIPSPGLFMEEEKALPETIWLPIF